MLEFFSVRVNRTDDRVMFHLAGEMDIMGGPAILAAVEDAQLDESVRLELDMTDVTFLDSSGIQALVQLHLAQEAEQRGRVVLINLRDQPARVLELGGVAALFDIRRGEPPAD